MSKVKDLKKKELVELQNEPSLEDLITLGDDTRIPIVFDFITPKGDKVKARTLIKQLTVAEMKNINPNSNSMSQTLNILKKAMFKENGELFTTEELSVLPIGTMKAIADQILEVSGIDDEQTQQLKDF